MERALIDALAVRYSADPAADRAGLDAAFADAMVAVATRFPDSDEVAVLAAEAVMDTTPWNYWQADKVTPVGRSMEAMRLLETVLARSPGHAQAAHLYIHMMENSRDPALPEQAPDRASERPPCGLEPASAASPVPRLRAAHGIADALPPRQEVQAGTRAPESRSF